MRDRLRTIIVDDEPLGREALLEALRHRADVEVVAVCTNGAEALAAAAELSPDLMLLDVQMPAVDGLTVARSLNGHPPPFVVFVTAHDEYAVRAFELEALDYVLKPIEDDRLNDCLDRVKRRHAAQRHESADHLRLALERLAPRGQEQFLVNGPGGKVTVVAASEIEYVTAADNYVRLHTSRGAPLLRGSLKSVGERLDPERFVRVHRSCLVDARRIREMRTLPNGDYELLLESGTTLPMSRNYRDAVFAKLGGRPR
jgi:two-component system, LytTR family, response regulator